MYASAEWPLSMYYCAIRYKILLVMHEYEEDINIIACLVVRLSYIPPV